MTAVLFRHRTAELEAWLAERHARGLDRYDEVWEGVYVVNPLPLLGHQQTVDAFSEAVRPYLGARGLTVVPGVNVGDRDDYRGPDVALVPIEADPNTLYFPEVPLVAEVRSPFEDPEEKLPFYLRRGVHEVVLLDWQRRYVRWLTAAADAWVDTDRSEVLDVAVVDVVAAIRWP
jgi:hypothetical protein